MVDKVVILGGGTFSKVSCHLALAAPAFGTTARQIASMYINSTSGLNVDLVLTKMANHTSSIIYTEDVQDYVQKIIKDTKVKIVVFNVAICDFEMDNPSTESRLDSREWYQVELKGVVSKLIRHLREQRPDIFIVGFKTTKDATEIEQLEKGSKLLNSNGLNLVLANDVGTRNNILLSNKGWHGTYERQSALQVIVTESLHWLKQQETNGNQFEAFKCYQ